MNEIKTDGGGPRTIWQAIWQVIREPWFGWTAFFILLFFYLHNPRIITVTKTETKTEIKTITRWKAAISALPGSITTEHANGDITITGPAMIRSEGNSASETNTTSRTSTKTTPADHDWSVSAGALFPPPYLPPVPQWQGGVGRRILGPIWLEAIAQLRPGLPSVGAGIRMEF